MIRARSYSAMHCSAKAFKRPARPGNALRYSIPRGARALAARTLISGRRRSRKSRFTADGVVSGVMLRTNLAEARDQFLAILNSVQAGIVAVELSAMDIRHD